MTLQEWDLYVDAVVVGAGACGLIAASRLAEFGLDVAVVEKMGSIHGNTALSQGMIPAAGTRFQRRAGIVDSPEILYGDIMNKNGHTSDPAVTRAVSEQAWRAVEWLTDNCGVDLSLCSDFNYPGFTHLRMHAPPSRAGKDLLTALQSHLKDQDNVTIALHAPLLEIFIQPDNQFKAAGVRISQNGEDVLVKAEAVVLAANGFGADKEMVEKFIPSMADALYFGHEGNTGDAIRLACDIGAQWSSMAGFQGHASVAVPHGILITWGTIMTGGILVNQEGKRFTNEEKGYSEMSLEIMEQPGSIAFELFDEVSFKAAMSVHDFRVAFEAGAIRKFQDAEQFAQSFQLPADAVAEVLEVYGSESEVGDAFGRPSPRKLTSPYYGVRVGPALFHTQGGLKINEFGQVCRRDGGTFENLYAGGGAAEGLSGNHPKGYLSGNGLLSAVTLGYIAGGHAADALKADALKTDR